MLLPQKGTRELRSMGIPLVQVCSLSPKSDLVLQPFSLTSCCLCFGWVNLYSMVGRAAAKVGGLAAGVHVLPHTAWAAAIWTHLLCWGRVLETPQEETHPNTAVRCPTCGRSITIRFGTWSVLSGTDLIVAARQNKAKNGVIYDYGKSRWENAVRLQGMPVYSQKFAHNVLFLCLNVLLTFSLYDHLHDFSFFPFSQCMPIKGLGFVLGAYKCICKAGFYHPSIFSVNSFQSKCLRLSSKKRKNS